MFDKLKTIRHYPYAIPDVPCQVQATKNQLLFYICVSEVGYLQMLVLSVSSLLLNTDAKEFHIKVYLDQKFRGTPEERFLRDCNIQVVYIPHFIPRYEVPFLPENETFDCCMNVDCDAFALPNSDAFFQTFAEIHGEIVCGFQYQDTETVATNLKFRQNQSNAFRDRETSEYLSTIHEWLEKNKQNPTTALGKRFWTLGFICKYEPSNLKADPLWIETKSFVAETLQTTCDETSTVLYHQLSNKAVDCTGLIPFSIGGRCYNAITGLVHPILGFQCEEHEKNIHLIQICTNPPREFKFDSSMIDDPKVREWYLRKKR